MHRIVASSFTPSPVLFPGQSGSTLRTVQYARILPLFAFFLLPPLANLVARPGPQSAAGVPPNPQALVQEAVQNGLRQMNDTQVHWSFRETVRKDERLETREICQTNAITIERLTTVNGQPLSAEQQGREDGRVQALLANASEIRKERQRQREDFLKQGRMFATFPYAFLYEYAGTDGDLVKLTFEPNPRFVPGSRQEEVFHHLEGTMWIDPRQKELARIDGRLDSEVKFAGGLLGYLEKGGVFSVRFKGLSSGEWVMAALDVEMNGKAMLFKTISVQEQRQFDDYHRVPGNLSLKQGAELLEKQASPTRQTAANTSK
jgi:hypothetical protein